MARFPVRVKEGGGNTSCVKLTSREKGSFAKIKLSVLKWTKNVEYILQLIPGQREQKPNVTSFQKQLT
jgi:hypothetical protein